MKRLIFWLTIVMTFPVYAQETSSSIVDSMTVDTMASESPKKIGLIRRIIRGFDEIDERYIEPQHYVYAAMLQATRNYDFYTMRSTGPNRQTISFSPDSEIPKCSI